MTAYAIATLTEVRMGPDIIAYLEQIDATLFPYDGRFLVHGGPKQELEGSWPGDVIVIAFPDLDHATRWYGSAAYRRIKPLRTLRSAGTVILVEGVGADHKATDVLAALA